MEPSLALDILYDANRGFHGIVVDADRKLLRLHR